MTDRERIDSLVKKTSDYADEIMELKQENDALRNRIAELENSAKDTNVRSKKRRHKLRAMTNGEFHDFYCYNHINTCQTDDNSDCSIRFICRMKGLAGIKDRPYKTKDGKYIIIEVKE